MQDWTYRRISVHLALCPRLVEEAEQGRNEWNSIAYHSVYPVKPLEPNGIISAEEDQVDVDCHGTRPHRVGLHEPIRRSKLVIREAIRRDLSTHISSKKPWNWHNGSFTWVKAEPPMSAATLANRFANEA